jgi:hypothetical protein
MGSTQLFSSYRAASPPTYFRKMLCVGMDLNRGSGGPRRRLVLQWGWVELYNGDWVKMEGGG